MALGLMSVVVLVWVDIDDGKGGISSGGKNLLGINIEDSAVYIGTIKFSHTINKFCSLWYRASWQISLQKVNIVVNINYLLYTTDSSQLSCLLSSWHCSINQHFCVKDWLCLRDIFSLHQS